MLVLACAVALTAVVAAGGAAGAAPAAKAASGGTALANLKVTEPTASRSSRRASPSYVTAKDGQALKQGDTIKTDAAGRAEIDYTDGSLTRLAGSTVFTISKLTNERGGRQTQGTLSVGETWNRAAKVSETGSFEVKAGRHDGCRRRHCVRREVRARGRPGSRRSPAPSLRWSTTSRSAATRGTSLR